MMTDKIDTLNDEQLDKKPATRTKKPKMFHVVLLNDDFSPMDFVVFILKNIFHKSQQEAEMLMLQVHIEGKGIAGTYTFEIAETKQILTMDVAKIEQHPLMAVLEEA